MQLGDAQKEFLIATLSGTERSLERAARKIHVSAPPSLFPEFVADAREAQRVAIEQGLAQFQVCLAQLLDRCGITPADASISGLQAFRVALAFAHVSLDEIAATRLGQFGSLDPFSAMELEASIERLREMLRDVQALAF